MTELVVISAADDAALVAETARVIDFLNRVPDAHLADVAFTCAQNRGPCSLAIIARDAAELRLRLVSAHDRMAAGTVKRLRDKSGTYWTRERLLGEGRGRLAFVYPGVMSFYPDMLRDLVVEFPVCRDAFDELEEALSDDDSFTPSSFVFPPAPYYRHDADVFKSGAYAQALVATYAGGVALTRLLADIGVSPDGLVGFAGGDLAAMMRSGAAGVKLRRPDRVRILRDIYHIVYKAVNHGGFPAVALVTVLLRHPGEIDKLVKSFPADKVMLAVDFSPRQKTFAVRTDFEATALSAFAAAGVRAVKLELDRPFNTPLSESLVPAVHKFAKTWMKDKPVADIYSCATAEKVPSHVRAARMDLASRWSKPVRFEETIRRMYADGYRVFLEVGPRGLMTSAVVDTLRGEPHAAIALNSIHRSGLLQLQHALAQLAALGAEIDVSCFFAHRRARRLDFSQSLQVEVRKDSEMRLKRAFPRLTLLSDEPLSGASAAIFGEPRGRGAKAAARAAAVAQQARRQRQFDFGASNPLVSDADIIESSPGISVELTKTFRISDLPFLGDFALGTSQLSYSDPNLRGLVLLSLPVGAEIMAETAQLVVPNRRPVAIRDLNCRRMVPFERGALTLVIRAEREASSDPQEAAVKVILRGNAPNGEYTWPVMEATVILREKAFGKTPAEVVPLERPQSVHWSGRDIYPVKLSYGRRLRGIDFVEQWGDEGLDYEVSVPSLAGAVSFTQFPLWLTNPILLAIVTSGFPLWRGHEKFTGAFSFPFRMRELKLTGAIPKEGARLKCYLRLTGVTPKSHLCDIVVTDGNGLQLMAVSGWEELTERVPSEYRELILQPAMSYLTDSFTPAMMGEPQTEVSSAYITDVPYPVFERNEELWLKTLSHVILGEVERKEFVSMSGSSSRRTEWLFGRVAAKEAVRRFLKENYQARWSDADVQIWADDSGKPHALGTWTSFLSGRLDIAIAHTAQFVMAVAAANARVGVDVESTDRDLSEEFTAGVFTPEELELAAQGANAAQTVIRFWCAKEAVSKALGTGIRYSPKELVVSGFQADSGKVTMRLEGAWVEAFKMFKGRELEVTVKTARDHALAFCFIPSSLFDE